MRSIKNIQAIPEIIKMAYNCCECGVCEKYSCIMDLSPRRVNMMIKQELRSKGIKPLPVKSEVTSSPLREYRKVPVKRMIAKLGLAPFDRPAPFRDFDFQPDMVRIPLSQHIGAPAVPVVDIGEVVERGSIIARIPKDALGANIHASIDGMIKGINGSIIIERHRGGKL